MPVVGSQWNEIKAVRNNVKPPVRIKQINRDVKIKNITEKPSPVVGGDQKMLSFEFEFKVSYILEGTGKKKKTNLGEIYLSGEILFIDKKEKIAAILKDWKKKKISDDVMREVLQVALDQSHVESMNLAQKIMLPSPIPLPVLQRRTETSGYIG